MRCYLKLLVTIGLIGNSLLCGRIADAATLPFQPGERLTYAIRWGFIPAGTVIFEVGEVEQHEGVPSYRFAMTASTNRVASKIYRVRDSIDAYADVNLTRSGGYHKIQQEGFHKRNVVVAFDWENGTAQYANFGKEKAAIPVTPGTFDPLSFFYKFRSFELEENGEYFIPITDGKKMIEGRLVVKERQLISTNTGEQWAWLVEPQVSEIGGVFRKSRKAKLQIWFSDDNRRIPIKFSSKVIVGRFTGELIAVE